MITRWPPYTSTRPSPGRSHTTLVDATPLSYRCAGIALHHFPRAKPRPMPEPAAVGETYPEQGDTGNGVYTSQQIRMAERQALRPWPSLYRWAIARHRLLGDSTWAGLATACTRLRRVDDPRQPAVAHPRNPARASTMTTAQAPTTDLASALTMAAQVGPPPGHRPITGDPSLPGGMLRHRTAPNLRWNCAPRSLHGGSVRCASAGGNGVYTRRGITRPPARATPRANRLPSNRAAQTGTSLQPHESRSPTASNNATASGTWVTEAAFTPTAPPEAKCPNVCEGTRDIERGRHHIGHQQLGIAAMAPEPQVLWGTRAGVLGRPGDRRDSTTTSPAHPVPGSSPVPSVPSHGSTSHRARHEGEGTAAPAPSDRGRRPPPDVADYPCATPTPSS